MAKSTDKTKEEGQQQQADLPSPAFGRGDVPAERDMSRYAGQQEAQHAIENDMPPWADFRNDDGSWHINQQYRGGVPDWWRDHSTNKTRQAMTSYLDEYEALQKRLAELGQGNAAGMPPGTTGTPGYGGGGGGTFRPDMPGQAGGFPPDAFSSNVQGYLYGQNFANQYEAPRASAAMYGPGTGVGSSNVQAYLAAQPFIQQQEQAKDWRQRYQPQPNASMMPPQQQPPPQSRYQMFIPTAGQMPQQQAWNPWGGAQPMTPEEQQRFMEQFNFNQPRYPQP